MFDGFRLTVADDDIRLIVEDRAHQRGNVWSVILIVAIGIDDDVGAEPQRRIDPALKALREAPIGAV